MKVYKSAAYESKGKIYVGSIDKDGKIFSFRPTLIRPKDYKSGKMYVVMVDEVNIDKGIQLYHLTDTMLVEEGRPVEDVGKLDVDEVLHVANQLLTTFNMSSIIH